MAERNSKRSREPASDSPQNSFSPRSTSLKRGGSSKLSVEFLLNQEPDPVSSCSGGNRPARPVSRPIPISKSSSGGSGELEETSSEVSSDHSVQGKEESSHPQHQRHESQSSSTHSPLNAPRVQGSPAQLGPVEKRRTLSPMRLHGQSDVHPRPSADRSTAATAPRNQQSTLDDLRPTSPALAQRAQSSPRGSFHASSSRISEQQPVPVHSAQRGSPSRGDSGNESERTFSCSRCNKTFKERGNVRILNEFQKVSNTIIFTTMHSPFSSHTGPGSHF